MLLTLLDAEDRPVCGGMLGARPLWRLRAPAPSWAADGTWDRGPEDQEPICGSVQPAPGSTFVELPEGQRRSVSLRVFTVHELRAVDQHGQAAADRVYIDGVRYEVLRVREHGPVGMGLGHYVAECGRLAEGDTR